MSGPLRVWRKRLGPDMKMLEDERCLLCNDGNYVGINTGTVYPAESHYHSPQYKARVKGVDAKNHTGMYHLNEGWNDTGEENRVSWKRQFIGCYVTVEEAHNWGSNLIVYRCVELGDYWSGDEIELLDRESGDGK